jgi:nitronate monooxygenase
MLASERSHGNWPRRAICELFGIEHPILLAPMAGATTPALVAAALWAGQATPLNRSLPAAELVAVLVEETRRALTGA